LKKIVLLISAFVCMLLISTSAKAIGVGAYVDLGVGSTTWEGDFQSSGGTIKGSATDLIPTGGLILDTAAAKNKIFNYRFKFGGGKMLSGAIKLDKVGMVHTLGLSPMNFRGDQARFFFGPRIGMYYVGGEYEVAPPLSIMTFMFWPFGFLLSQPAKIHLDLVRFDLGLVLLGFNFNLGEAATITFEFGGNYGIMLGEKKGTITAPGYEIFATMGFMYRINDTFIESSKTADNNIQVKDLK
jgi:hypothetical protein